MSGTPAKKSVTKEFLPWLGRTRQEIFLKLGGGRLGDPYDEPLSIISLSGIYSRHVPGRYEDSAHDITNQ